MATIKIVQLRDLRNIIAEVVEEPTEDSVLLIKPLMVILRQAPGSDVPLLDLIEAFPFAQDQEKVFYPKSSIVHSYVPFDDIVKGYKMKTSGLVAAPEPSLIVPS